MTKNNSNDFEMVFTRPLSKIITPSYKEELESKFKESMLLFPELHPKTVKFGLRRKYVACARTYGFKDNQDIMLFGINPVEKLYYYTMGHEITHFMQEICNIPHGEKQCDVWTLARSELFIDKPPRYIDMASVVKKNWKDYKFEVRELCIKGIEVRKTERYYIQRIEEELIKKCLDN